MNRLGDEFLSRARFSQDEHGRIGAGKPLRLLEHPFQRRTAAANSTKRGLGSAIDAVKRFFGESLDVFHAFSLASKEEQTIVGANQTSINTVISWIISPKDRQLRVDLS